MSGDRRLSVRVTSDMERHLAMLSDVGLSASDAVREAVRLLAMAHQTIATLTEQGGGVPPWGLTIPRDAIPGAQRDRDTVRDDRDVSRTG